MSPESHENGAQRDELRRYALGTLPESERVALDERLASDESLREALEEARAELAQLDLLPHSDVPAGLADRTIARVLEEGEPARAPFLRPAVWGTLAAAVLVIVIALPYMGRAREAAMRASTENNMKQLGLVFKMYAGEAHREAWPPAVPVDGIWVPDLRTLYPEFLTDPGILIARGRAGGADRLELTEALEQEPPDWDAAHRIVARHLVYTGYTLPGPEAIEAFTMAAVPPGGEDYLDEDGHSFMRLREGIERFFITDINNPAASATAQSDLPVAVYRADHPGRLRVLYMDGHVAEVTRPGDPALFQALERLLHPAPEAHTPPE